MAQKGPGPMPAISMILIPFRGPMGAGFNRKERKECNEGTRINRGDIVKSDVKRLG